MQPKMPVLVCVICAGLWVTSTSAVNIELVKVGDAGNAGDTRYPHGGVSSFGAVGYAYNIGKYEVTAGQYTAFLNKVAATDPYGLYSTSMWSGYYGCKIRRSGSSGSYTYSVADDRANRPVNNVSYWDTCRFTNWLHNGQPTGAQGVGTTETGAYTLNGYNGTDGRTIQRNPDWKWAVTSEDEWYKAAYYKGGSTNAGYWDYPTRSDTAPGRDMADVSGNNANYCPAPLVGPYPIDSPYYTTVAGQFQNSPGPYGTFDQAGNVWERNEAIVAVDEGTGYAYRSIRGGSFFDDRSDGHLRPSFRPMTYSTIESDIFGFRVVEVPEPTVLALLGMGGLTVARRRQRSQ